MIYTIGHRTNYLKAIAEHGEILKAKGGYAFKTIEDAMRRREEEGQVDVWAVWQVDADWELHTEPVPYGWWHLLTRDSAIIGEVQE